MIDIIKSRRSIRKFILGEISDEQINVIVEAAMYAPSARNTQSWHFVVIRDKEKLNKLAGIHPYAAMLKQAACCIVVCADSSIEGSNEYAAVNCAAATQNILLAIHSLGLGGVWLGVYPRKERMKAISEFLKIPEHIFPFSAVAAGYPAETPPQPDRYRPERVHMEEFS